MKPMGFFIWQGEAGNSSGMPLAGTAAPACKPVCALQA
jgi:hypothetical protein